MPYRGTPLGAGRPINNPATTPQGTAIPGTTKTVIVQGQAVPMDNQNDIRDRAAERARATRQNVRKRG